MLLKTLSYQDKKTGWTVHDLKLDRFNLLVGASGVGKTRILKAIQAVQAIATGQLLERAISFRVGFEHAGQVYVWELESTLRTFEDIPETPSNTTVAPALITHEILTGASDGELIRRDADGFRFRGGDLPQLNRSQTALRLLDEPSIHLIRNGFSEFILNPHDSPNATFFGARALEKFIDRFDSLNRLRSHTSLTAVVKALVLQERFPEEFAWLKQQFIDVFPSVQDLAVHWDSPDSEGLSSAYTDGLLLFEFALKEQEAPDWVSGNNISSGMLRTLIFLIDLRLAPAGTVVLIDEFENSLGVNCMGPLTEFIQSHASELQLIITSHHPYIINKIPKSHWKVVRRKGSVVRVTPASDIRALQGTSAQDDFTRLLNSPEFEEGLA